MFEVNTEREETAYRLGYCDGRAGATAQTLAMASRVACSPTVYTMREIFGRMRDYQIAVLWYWRNEESPKIGEPLPEFEVS